MATACLVCGLREDEVEKMHYFPKFMERSKIWQEHLGMKITEVSLRNYRICNKHFSSASYIDSISYRLRRDAVPMLWVSSEVSSEVPSLTNVGTNLQENDGSQNACKDVTFYRISVQETITDCRNLPSTSKTSTSHNIPTTPATAIVEEMIPLASSSQTPVSHKRAVKIFRDIENLVLSNATPRKKKLIKIIHKKEDHLRKVKRLCKQRPRDIKALSNLSDSNVIKNLFEDMPSVTANFLISQVKNVNTKGGKGRRWTLDDKILSLCIFKRSPRCYQLLRKFVALPTKSTALGLLKKVPFQVGINPHLFRNINDSLPNNIDRCCALLFDDIDIKENVQYDVGEDRILGFEDFGKGGDHNKPLKLANKALVFMLVGLCSKWKQPIAFYFTNNGCNSANLTKCIMEVLHAAKYYAEVDVVTTVCDMGVNNVKCLKGLGVTIESPFFKFENKVVFAMYDPPHLLKCTYSLFRKYNVLISSVLGHGSKSGMEARFGDIKKAYEIDSKNPLIFRTLHKIKETHLNPIMQYAMKVSVAAQILSHTVAAFLYSLISTGVVNQSVVATATFVKDVDTLFDSFNGRTLGAPEGKPLRCAIKKDSPHLQYWTEAHEKIKQWTFIRLNKNGTIKTSKPPSQIGWLTSLNAIRGIWEYVHDKGFDYLRPRSLNQDPLENLFGSVRYGCGCNDNPTVKQFIGSLKTQILNGLTNHSFAKNCEDDDNTILSNLKTFLNVDNVEESELGMLSDSTTVNVDENLDIITNEIAASAFS